MPPRRKQVSLDSYTPTGSPWQQHVKKWCECTRCELSKIRAKVVLARGSLPCNLLFVGEAPGESENAVGKPFVGPAGILLDNIIKRALPDGVTYAFTNVVSCIPREEDGSKTSEPPLEALEACTPRLQEIVQIADPKLLVCVGKTAEDWLAQGYRHSIEFHRDVPILNIIHPAAILRKPLAQRGLLIQRTVVQISNAVRKLP